MKKLWTGAVLLLWIVMVISCDFSLQKEGNTEQVLTDQPAEFVAMQVPEHNPMQKQKIALGRMLFYDPVLSIDSTISCSSCHLQQLAFTDGRPKSIGVRGRKGQRSALSLANVGYYYKGLFWDGKSATLEAQVVHPITDTLEMAAGWDIVVSRLSKMKRYKQAFAEAFGGSPDEITPLQVAQCLAQFQRTIVSNNSKYDRHIRGEIELTATERRGMAIFFDESDTLPKSECGHCHTDPLFTNQKFENNGIDPFDQIEKDRGRQEITGNRYDKGKFRVPTLRNIALTAPYMHDGRFETLQAVIDHYASGGHAGINVSPNVMPLQLGERDKKDLIAFLNALTDSTLIVDPSLSDPFTLD